MSADTDLIRAYGHAVSDHVADLQEVASRLNTLSGATASMFGPVGARFQAALTRAAENEAHHISELGVSVSAGGQAASKAARAYAAADADAGNRLTGSW